jgi:hypothetical protein
MPLDRKHEQLFARLVAAPFGRAPSAAPGPRPDLPLRTE